MSRIFDNWFSFEGFQAWKLQTGGDYFFFFLLIAVGIAVLFVATKVLASRRNHDAAVKRTAKRLTKLGGKGAVCYCGKTVRGKGGSLPCDLICVAQDKVYVARVYHFGLEVYGGASKQDWQFRYYKEEHVEPNPLPALEDRQVMLNQLLARGGVRNVSVDCLVVFADNFGSTKFLLPGVKCAVSYSHLKKWRKDRPLSGGKYDMEATKKVLEASFAED